VEKMAKPFNKLRAAFRENDLTQADVATESGIDVPGLSRRLNCKMEWRLDEMYIIMDLIHQPYHRLHEYFPRNGINESGTKRRKRAA
jgi:transposase